MTLSFLHCRFPRDIIRDVGALGRDGAWDTKGRGLNKKKNKYKLLARSINSGSPGRWEAENNDWGMTMMKGLKGGACGVGSGNVHLKERIAKPWATAHGMAI